MSHGKRSPQLAQEVCSAHESNPRPGRAVVIGCACKDKSLLTPNSLAMGRAYPGPTDDGVVMLRSAPECTTPYSGIYKQATVFVIGYDTDSETLFTRGERTAALKMAKEQNLTFNQVVARSLCHETVVALLGA